MSDIRLDSISLEAIMELVKKRDPEQTEFHQAACSLGKEEARQLVNNDVLSIAEGANMPCTDDAIKFFENADTLYAPGKASNTGGVAVSGLEMTQNAKRLSWDFEQVDNNLISQFTTLGI